MSKVCGVQFATTSIRRFFPRISNNELPSNVGKQNGKVWWSHFKNKIEEFIRVSRRNLEILLCSPDNIPEYNVFALNEKLKSICNLETMENFDTMLENGSNFANQFNTIVKQCFSTSSN